MKKVLSVFFAAALMLLATESYAQIYFAAGYINAQDKSVLSEKITNTTTTEKVDLNGVYAGAYYNMNLGFVDDLGLAPGIYVTTLFGKKDGISHRDLAVNIPVNLTYSFDITNDFKVFGFGGPALSFGLVKKASYTFEGTTHTTDYFNKDYGRTFRRANVLLGLGAGFEVAELIQVSVGAELGLIPQYKFENELGGARYTRPYQLKLGVGYRF